MKDNDHEAKFSCVSLKKNSDADHVEDYNDLKSVSGGLL